MTEVRQTTTFSFYFKLQIHLAPINYL